MVKRGWGGRDTCSLFVFSVSLSLGGDYCLQTVLVAFPGHNDLCLRSLNALLRNLL